MDSNSEYSFAETHSQVFLTFYKSPKEKDLKPLVELKDPTTLIYMSQEIALFSPVKMCKIEDSKFKTEVVLTKKTPAKWNSIDGTVEMPVVNEEIYKEEKNESPESIMDLFRNIYSSGDENVKKAMNKSISESNGTVLNTNWSEVGSKKINPEKE